MTHRLYEARAAKKEAAFRAAFFTSGFATTTARGMPARPDIEHANVPMAHAAPTCHVYTDGSYTRATPGTRTKPPTDARAGWGVVVYEPAGGTPDCHNGPVVLDRRERAYCGAQRKTNNTAELEGIGRALQLLLRRDEKDRAIIHTDSEYARKAVTGSKQPSTNVLLIKWARRQYSTARRAYTHLAIQYVEAHRGVEGNEQADAQAKIGAAKDEEKRQARPCGTSGTGSAPARHRRRH